VATASDADLVTVIATLKAKSGREDELRAALISLVEPTRSEDGNVNYDLYESPEQPGLFYFYENWRSLDALGKHAQSPAMQAAMAKTGELLDGPPTITRLTRVA
jgi:quinol monooxygenase YgiN